MSRGTIREHGPGKWRIQGFGGRDPVTGKERRPSLVVHGSKKDAERALTRLLAELDAHKTPVSGTRTFGQAIEAFLDHKALSLEAGSVDNYRRNVSYIPERLRGMPVAKVDVEHLEALYAHLATSGHKRTGEGLAPKSVRNIHVTIFGVFELARRRHWVTVNPAADAEPPSVRKRPPTPADPTRIPALFKAAADQHPWLPAYLRLTLCIGARRSEVHGLRWSGVDFPRSRITLRDVVVPVSGKWVVKPRTKTGEFRTVHVDGGTLEALRQRHAEALELAVECDTSLSSSAFVFSDAADGSTHWIPSTTLARFKRACKSAGLPETTRPHDLRHLMATYLIDQGQPIPVVSARLGHAQNSTTLDIYTGRVAASDAAAADLMGRFLDGPAPG